MMKTSKTTSVQSQKKDYEVNIILLLRLSAAALLLSILVVLLYKNYYGWSIGLVMVSTGAFKIYGWYQELINFDWSINVAELSMEDVIADLENTSHKITKPGKLQERVQIMETEKMKQTEEVVFSPVLV